MDFEPGKPIKIDSDKWADLLRCTYDFGFALQMNFNGTKAVVKEDHFMSEAAMEFPIQYLIKITLKSYVNHLVAFEHDLALKKQIGINLEKNTANVGSEYKKLHSKFTI